MSRSPAGRGLLVVAVLLALLAVVVDLSRPGSWLLGVWDSLSPSTTRAEQTVDKVHETRP